MERLLSAPFWSGFYIADHTQILLILIVHISCHIMLQNNVLMTSFLKILILYKTYVFCRYLITLFSVCRPACVCLCACVCVYVHVLGNEVCTYHGTHGEVTGQLPGVSYLLPPCDSWGWNSGRKALWQMHLPMEPSLWLILKLLLVQSQSGNRIFGVSRVV